MSASLSATSPRLSNDDVLASVTDNEIESLLAQRQKMRARHRSLESQLLDAECDLASIEDQIQRWIIDVRAELDAETEVSR